LAILKFVLANQKLLTIFHLYFLCLGLFALPPYYCKGTYGWQMNVVAQEVWDSSNHLMMYATLPAILICVTEVIVSCVNNPLARYLSLRLILTNGDVSSP